MLPIFILSIGPIETIIQWLGFGQLSTAFSFTLLSDRNPPKNPLTFSTIISIFIEMKIEGWTPWRNWSKFSRHWVIGIGCASWRYYSSDRCACARSPRFWSWQFRRPLRIWASSKKLKSFTLKKWQMGGLPTQYPAWQSFRGGSVAVNHVLAERWRAGESRSGKIEIERSDGIVQNLIWE